MYFLSKKLRNAWVIAIYNDYLYAVKEDHNGLYLYQKDVFEVEKWVLLCQLKIHLAHICQYCKKNLPMATGISNSELWIMATGFIKDQTKITPHVFCINLRTKKIRKFKTSEKRVNDIIKQICIQCHCLRIINEENSNRKMRFLVESNRIRAYPTKAGMPDFPNFPAFKQFYFIIDKEKNSCDFGQNDYMPLFSIFSAGIICNENKLGLFVMGRNLGIGTIDDQKFNIISNFEAISDSDNIEFWRNENNELHCFIQRKKKDFCKLDVYQVNFNFVENFVSFIRKSSFYVGLNFPMVLRSQIFSTSSLFVFQSYDAIVTAVNKMLSLFELSYFTIVNIPKNLNSENKCWMSMNYFYDHFNVPKQIKYPYRHF